MRVFVCGTGALHPGATPPSATAAVAKTPHRRQQAPNESVSPTYRSLFSSTPSLFQNAHTKTNRKKMYAYDREGKKCESQRNEGLMRTSLLDISGDFLEPVQRVCVQLTGSSFGY
jgi:hypothetical protein